MSEDGQRPEPIMYPTYIWVRHIVIRAAPDLPPGFLPPDYEGRWIERPPPDPLWDEDAELRAIQAGYGVAVAVATGRFETRDDGAIAEVYEVRP